jgi:uridine phosphorylase
MRFLYQILRLCIVVGSCALAACANEATLLSQDEVARSTSPDSLVDAVIVRSNAGATTPFVYRVYVVPAGQDIPRQEGYENFRADKVEDLSLRWKSAGALDIEYKAARIFHFSNFWNSKSVKNFEYTVRLRLVPEPDSAGALPRS